MRFITGLVDDNNIVILAADINEYIVKGKVAKELKTIGLVDSCVKRFHQSGLHLILQKVI